jgi:N-acetylglutamate synthase-like GNAT family acetyltransferase
MPRSSGFDPTFEAHVAEPLAAFARSSSKRQRLWIAEAEHQMQGCVGIVEADASSAQLRWFLVAPEARGSGLGRRLLNEAVSFSRSNDYERIFLWTVNLLHAAAHLYRSVGFKIVEAKPERLWGVDVIEECYELRLT